MHFDLLQTIRQKVPSLIELGSHQSGLSFLTNYRLFKKEGTLFDRTGLPPKGSFISDLLQTIRKKEPSLIELGSHQGGL